jgi:hypothetical protein
LLGMHTLADAPPAAQIVIFRTCRGSIHRYLVKPPPGSHPPSPDHRIRARAARLDPRGLRGQPGPCLCHDSGRSTRPPCRPGPSSNSRRGAALEPDPLPHNEIRKLHLRVTLARMTAVFDIVALAGGTVSLLNTKVSAWARHQSPDIHYGTVAAVFIVSLVLAAWTFKAIYLVAIDLFRADDAHPLLVPFASTIVTWVLAFKVLLDGGPTGIPRDIGLWMCSSGQQLSLSSISGHAEDCGASTIVCYSATDRVSSLILEHGTGRAEAVPLDLSDTGRHT